MLIFLNIFLCIYFGTYVCTVHIVHIYTKYICRTRVVAGHIYVDISHNTEDEYIFVDTSTSDLLVVRNTKDIEYDNNKDIIKKMSQINTGWSPMIYVNVDSPNLGFTYLNYLGEEQWR